MWVDRIKIIIVSLLLSLLVLPIVEVISQAFLMGAENESLLDNYRILLFVFAVYATPVILCTAVPVNLIAGAITKKVKCYKHLISFLIHIIPAVLIGIMGGLGFTSLTVLVAMIFFCVDYLVLHKQPSMKFRYILLVPIAIILFSSLPAIMDRAQDAIDFTVIKSKETPEIDLYVNKEKVSIRPGSCWNSDNSEGCMGDTEPIILPISPVGIDEFVVSGEVEIEVDVAEEEKYPIKAYYLDGAEIVEVNVNGNKFTLPAHIHEQVVKVVVTTESNQILSFAFGIRNGVRDY